MLRTIIIDDEENGRFVLLQLLKKFNKNIDVVGTAHSAAQGRELRQSVKPDLVFLDIEMPIESGFDVLEKIGAKDFEVIFLSVHAHHALKAIRFSPAAFLMKPIDINELTAAIEHVAKKTERSEV